MRLAVLQLERELFPIYIETQNPRKKRDALKKLAVYLDSLNTYLARQEYFIGEQYTLADVTMAPILWRLSSLGMDTAKWNYLEGYMDRLFERPAFERSLSEFEQMLRDY
jgi:RNA polymerase-associated protein